MQDADQHGGEIGAGDAAEPADDDHDEGLRDHRQVHVQRHRLARQLQRATQAGEHRTEGEDRGEEQALVDAERADHLAVLRRGPHQRAPARLLEQKPQDQKHHRPDRDEEQLIGREAVAEDHDEALEAGRTRADLVLRPPDRQRHVLQHQHDAEGREQLEQLRRLVDPPEDQHLDDDADQPCESRRRQHAAPEAEHIRRSEAPDQRPGQIGPEHVERAMREVHDPRDAEDDRQPRRYEEQRRGRGQAVQRLGEDEVDHAGNPGDQTAPSSRAPRSGDPGSMPERFRNGSRIGAARAACPG